MACDVITSVKSYPAEYYFAAEQASGCPLDPPLPVIINVQFFKVDPQ